MALVQLRSVNNVNNEKMIYLHGYTVNKIQLAGKK